MAVTVVSRPDDFSSAYQPVEYTFTSSYANISSSVNVVGDFGGVALFFTDEPIPPDSITIGSILTITNTENGLYDGEHVITNTSGGGLIFTDTPFIGSSSGGNASVSRLDVTVVCDLYINGSFVIRKTRFSNLNNQFVFDFEKEIQPNIGNDLKPLTLSTNLNTENPESSKLIHVTYADSFTENIDGSLIPSSSLPTFADLLIDDSANAITVINSTVPLLEWSLGSVRSELISIDTDLSSFIMGVATGQRFLTNSPKTISIGRNESYQLSAIIDYDPVILYRKRVRAYDSSGSLLNTTSSALNANSDSVFDITCGTRDLNVSTIPANATSYDVRVVDTAGGGEIELSETITFLIDDNCNGSETRFVWLNPRGGYDAFTFKSPRKLNSSVSKGVYNRAKSFPVDISDREESIISVIANDSITTSTNKVTKKDAEWLQELLESPQVFIELSEGNALHETRIPVTLINKTRSICNSYKSLFNVSIRYRFGFSKTPIRPY